jgi:hypothetical protein
MDLGEVFNNLNYLNISSILPEDLKFFILLIGLTIVIFFYGLFTWSFYRFLSKRDVLELNLNEYKSDEYSLGKKFLDAFLYFLEFILIYPVSIILWFSVLSLFLIVISNGIEINMIILLCASIIAAVRILSYINEKISKEIAKIIPLSLLSILIVSPNGFNVSNIIEKIIQIPSLFNKLLYSLIFIFMLEVILRINYLIKILRKKREKDREKSNLIMSF